jgi:hypothetical protein
MNFTVISLGSSALSVENAAKSCHLHRFTTHPTTTSPPIKIALFVFLLPSSFSSLLTKVCVGVGCVIDFTSGSRGSFFDISSVFQDESY